MEAFMISTRDPSASAHSYTDVLLAGLAPDGGLYVPSAIPHFSVDELRALKALPYPQLAYEVKRKLVAGAIPDEDLKAMTAAAYSGDVFAYENGQTAPVRELGEGIWLENLSTGPTASFKDMAMQLLGREMDYELARRKEELTILGATSGDTGSAAEAAFKGLERITLFMLSPEEGMSEFQKAQMGALSGDNVFNISIRGRFDDCQDLVKAVKAEPEFAGLGAVNSINWGRISSQIPYYFSGYLQLVRNVGDEIDVTVPSGNFGNVLSAYYARRMGLPLRKLVVATNENNVLDTLIRTGVYESSAAQVTSSPSMDISKASNYERLAFEVLGNDPQQTARYMREFAKSGRVDLSSYGVKGDVFTRMGFESGMSAHAERLATIKATYERSGVIIDPHTADGVCVAHAHNEAEVPMLCMATALPLKFERTVKEALPFTPERPARFAQLERSVRSDAFTVLDANADALKAYIRARTES